MKPDSNVSDERISECRTQQVAQAVQLIRTNTTQHQVNLFQAFLISKLVTPVGLRQPWTDQEEDIDLDLDENDLSAWEVGKHAEKRFKIICFLFFHCS